MSNSNGGKMKIFIISLVVVLMGCAAAGPKSSLMNGVALGMSKAEVIAAMGQPSRISANNNTEYMIYRLVYDVLRHPFGNIVREYKSDYFIQIESNRVTKYGRVGDFDSTKNPESTINVNQTIKKIN